MDEPAEFTAVTATRSVLPSSAEPTVWVDVVAPEIGAQLAPAELQRCHRYS
jgi:hypothetical protein